MTDLETRLAVIGGGPGGYAAAFLAADLGLEVTLIDPEENPGGVCLYRGCIPSKTLLHAARLITEAREAESWGVRFDGLTVDPDRLRAHKQEVVAQLTGGLGQLVKRRKIRHLRARAAFADSGRLQITDVDGNRSTLAFEDAIIATGSRAVRLPAFESAGRRLMTATRALDLESVPETLLVVGGGYIGLELGSVYAALGTRVTVVEMTAQLLPGADKDMVRILSRSLAPRFEAVMLDTTVTAMTPGPGGLQVTLERAGEEPEARTFDQALLAVGRRPSTEGLGLENTTVRTDEKGFILVDEQRRTHDARIFAIGDVAGEPMLAHKASHEGRVAAEAAAGRKVIYQPAAIPAVVFTDPEMAWVGLTETAARAGGIAHTVTRFPWAASGRASTLGRTDGLTKMLIDPETERVLGVGIVGPGAGEMIAEGVLAIEMAATATDVALAIHPHPTLSETVMEAADMLHGTATHVHRPVRKKK